MIQLFYTLILHLFNLPLSPIYSIHAIHYTKLYCQVTNSHHYNDTNDARLQMNKLYAYPLFNTYIRVIVKGEPMKDKDLLKLLLQNGWKDVRQRGSHHRLKKR